MQVNHSVRRIASIFAFVLAVGVTSASQAGIIPWVYDAIFGPVHYPSYGYGYGYSPYAVSYSRPVVIRSAPVSYGYPTSGCSSCSTSYYAPVSYSAPSYGCGPIAMAPSCGPCGAVTYSASQGCLSGCSASPTPADAKSPPVESPAGKSAWTTKKTPEKDPAPAPSSVTDDGLGTSPRSRGKAPAEPKTIDEDQGTRPASGEEERTILNRQKAPPKTDVFQPPVENNQNNNPEPPETDKNKKPNELDLDFDGKNPGEAQILKPVPALNLDAKIAWRTEPQRARVPFHAKLAKASVTRRIPGAAADWTPVVAKAVGTQVAKK